MRKSYKGHTSTFQVTESKVVSERLTSEASKLDKIPSSLVTKPNTSQDAMDTATSDQPVIVDEITFTEESMGEHSDIVEEVIAPEKKPVHKKPVDQSEVHTLLLLFVAVHMYINNHIIAQWTWFNRPCTQSGNLYLSSFFCTSHSLHMSRLP